MCAATASTPTSSAAFGMCDMEIDITRFVRAHRDHMESFSDSIANSGLQDIGRITWRNACDAFADEVDWLTSDLDALRSHFREYGAWDDEELHGMDGKELNALLAQFIAGDFQRYTHAREQGRKAFKRWQENHGGRLQGARGRWWYYIGT